MLNRTLGIPFEFNLRFPLLEDYPEKCFYVLLFSFNRHLFAVAIRSLVCWGSGGKGVAEGVYFRSGANKAILNMESVLLY